MIRSRLLRWGRILLALMILFFLGKRLYDLFSTLEMEVSVEFRPVWLLISLSLLLVYFATLSIPWLLFYRAGDGKSEKAYGVTSLINEDRDFFFSAWIFFQLSQLGRYLPGKVGQFVWMLSISDKFRIDKKRAVLATCLQLAFQCVLGCFIGVLALRDTEVAPILLDLLTDFQISGKTGFLIVSIGSVALGTSIVLLYRKLIKETFAHLIQQDFHTMFLIPGIHHLISGSFLLWGLLGIAFFFFIKSFYTVEISQFIIVTGIYAVAWNIGFLSLVTPSGLGVREGVLSLLLTTVLPPATATLTALLSRLWTLSAELLITLVALGFSLREKHT